MKNMPILRFKEFNGEWEEKSLSEIANKKIQKNKNNQIHNVFTNSATQGIVNQRDYFDKDIANQGNLLNYYVVEKDDFIYNPRISTFAPVGPIMRNHIGTGVMSPLYTVFKITQGNFDFFEIYFSTFKWHEYMKSIASYGARADRMNINSSRFFSMPLPFPSLQEQQKIASFLTAVDNKIEIVTKKIENLESYKKGLMQKLLTGEIRFPGFNDEWEEEKLGEILKERNTYNIKNESFEHLSLTKEGVLLKSKRYDRDFLVNAFNKKYKITYKNDICYNPANLKFGVICKNNYGEGIFSPIYITFEVNKNFNTDFINFFITTEHFINNALQYQQGTVYERMSVHPKDLLRMKISIPYLPEQQKIASFLTAVDKKIELNKNKSENLKTYKKGLLQKMFV